MNVIYVRCCRGNKSLSEFVCAIKRKCEYKKANVCAVSEPVNGCVV
jgi:hypothetical protein